MNKTHIMRRGNAVRAVMSITAAAALAGAMAVQPAAAQTQASSDLRTNLTASFAEHTLLAGNATAAILGNRPDEVQAAQAALNQNSTKIAGLIGNLYGGNANSAFLPLWQRHIQYYADYANSLKAGDQNGRQQAASNLMQWSVDMGTLLNSPSQFRGTVQAGTQNAAGNLSGMQAMLTQMMQQHVMDTMKVIDAQAANNWPQVYSLAAADVRHMKNVADDLINVHGITNAAAYQGANADLKANLAMLLVENAALNANATSAMLNNRTPEYQAAISALEVNAAAMSGLLAPVYGGSTYNNVNSLWTNQSLKLAQYANALANQDVSTQEAARANVRGFTADFVAQFNQSNAQLPAATINGWGGVLTTNAIRLIDAQDANNYAQEYQLRSQTNQYLLQLPEIVGQSVSQQFPNQYGIPSAPSVPANVGAVNDNTSVATNNAGAGTTASTSTGTDNTAGTGGANTSTGTASVSGSDTAGTVSASGDASTTGAGTVLLPTTGSDLNSSAGQVTGTTTTTGTTGTSTAVTSTTGTTGTTTTGTSATGTATSTTTSGSVLLPSTGADLSSSAHQVTGTTTTTGTTGTGTTVTSTTGTTGTTTTGTSATGTATSTTTSGSVLLPSTGADLGSSVGQVTGTATTTGTTGAGTTTTGTTATDNSGVLLPQSGADLSQQQQVTPNTMVPLALVIAGVALVMAVVLMSFASRDHGRQKRDE